MKLTEIHVGWEETCSLPGFSNVRPSVRLTAQIEEGDDLEKVREELLARARQAVRDQVDQALVLSNCEPKYSSCRRGDLLMSRDARQILLIDSYDPDPAGFNPVQEFPRGMTWDLAVKRGKSLAQRYGFGFIEAPDGYQPVLASEGDSPTEI
jgi:hypothetical protein